LESGSKNIVAQGKRHKAQGNWKTGETSGKSKKGEKGLRGQQAEDGRQRTENGFTEIKRERV
jgi:hypothetical protein